MDTDWIETVMGLNTRILAAEAVVGAQVAAIVERTEAGEDTTREEGRLIAYQRDLRLLRALRDTLLDEVKDEA